MLIHADYFWEQQPQKVVNCITSLFEWNPPNHTKNGSIQQMLAWDGKNLISGLQQMWMMFTDFLVLSGYSEGF